MKKINKLILGISLVIFFSGCSTLLDILNIIGSSPTVTVTCDHLVEDSTGTTCGGITCDVNSASCSGGACSCTTSGTINTKPDDDNDHHHHHDHDGE